MNVRVKMLRSKLGLSQSDFAEKLGLTKNYISLVENGNRQFAENTIKSLCLTFDVNETWLRTGEGDMFVTLSRDEQIAAFVGKALSGKKDDEFKRRFISALSKLSEDAWKSLEEVCDRLAEEYKNKEEQD